MDLIFDKGTIVLEGFDKTLLSDFPYVKFDERSSRFRMPANLYREFVLGLISKKIPYRDLSKKFEPCSMDLTKNIVPRSHQEKALQAWQKQGKIGVVSLPTGAGKTILAVLAIQATKRPALVVVPTIDLLHQWQEVLKSFFGQEIGGLGGGERNLQDLTVSTYESAHRMIAQIGNQFGLMIFDECHHLPASQYQDIAKGSLAPFRLGLSATVERADGLESVLYDLVGPMVYQASIEEMVTKVLAPYDIVSIETTLTAEEQGEYDLNRKIYTDFVRRQGINFSSPRGWMDFVMRSSRSASGRSAMKAYRQQKRLAHGSVSKIIEVWKIIQQHEDDRVIIFTDENKFAYQVGRDLVLPVLTHHTKAKERKAILQAFKTGEFKVIVTSKVLNEGVDVPDANVGVVMSGSGAVREHVQRLGRILRFQPGKRSVLYEITSQGTGEKSISARRRQHNAYQRSP